MERPTQERGRRLKARRRGRAKASDIRDTRRWTAGEDIRWTGRRARRWCGHTTWKGAQIGRM